MSPDFPMLRFGDYMAGIGGASLGLQEARHLDGHMAFQCCWQYETDYFAREVLAAHWGDLWGDSWVTSPEAGISSPGGEWGMDVLIGQACVKPPKPKKKGVVKPHGTWDQFSACLRHRRPRWAILEVDKRNAPKTALGWFRRVLWDLHSLGYSACWSSIPACSLGAPSAFERLYIVAATNADLGDGRSPLERIHTMGDSERHAGEWRERVRGTLATHPRDGRDGTRIPKRLVDAVARATVPPIWKWLGYLIIRHEQIRSESAGANP